MARYPKNLTVKGYIYDDNGNKVLMWEIDADGNMTRYLPPDEEIALENKMMSNVGRNMSNYYANKGGVSA